MGREGHHRFVNQSLAIPHALDDVPNPQWRSVTCLDRDFHEEPHRGRDKYHNDVYYLRTQNSYQSLMATLGLRNTRGDFANVADENAVDAAYRDGPSPALGVGTNVTSSVNYLGDFDVYEFDAPLSQMIRLSVDTSGSSFLSPSLMVYNTTTESWVGTDLADRHGHAELSFRGDQGASYRVIVGGKDGNSTGELRGQLGRRGSLESRTSHRAGRSRDAWRRCGRRRTYSPAV